MKNEISDLERDLAKQYAKEVFNPEENFQDVYDTIMCEGDFLHNGYFYSFIYNEPGWGISYFDLTDAVGFFYGGCNRKCPAEYFDTRAELVSTFKLRNDGRTILEYYCDYLQIPRLLVPPVPKVYPDL